MYSNFCLKNKNKKQCKIPIKSITSKLKFNNLVLAYICGNINISGSKYSTVALNRVAIYHEVKKFSEKPWNIMEFYIS